MVLGGLVVGICILLLIGGFLFPRLSSKPENGVNRALGKGQQEASKAPGPLGRLLQRPFGTSRKATTRSASAGRRGRSKLPL